MKTRRHVNASRSFRLHEREAIREAYRGQALTSVFPIPSEIAHGQSPFGMPYAPGNLDRAGFSTYSWGRYVWERSCPSLRLRLVHLHEWGGGSMSRRPALGRWIALNLQCHGRVCLHWGMHGP